MRRGSIWRSRRRVRSRLPRVAGVVVMAVSSIAVGGLVGADVVFVQVGEDFDGEFDDLLGWAVSLSADGNRVAIGASGGGYVRVYDWDGSTWTQAGVDIVGEAAGDRTGVAVSLSADGNRVAIGAASSDCGSVDAGQVRVLDWDGTTWTQAGADMCGEPANIGFGGFLALSADGNRVATGAPGSIECGQGPGPVRVFEWDGTTWTQAGADIDGEPDSVRFGSGLALSANGDRVAIGTPSQSGTEMFGCDPDRYESGYTQVYD